MFQMMFVFCPICGKVDIVFVDTDWLIFSDPQTLPCDECVIKLETALKNAVDFMSQETDITLEDSTNGS